MWYEDARVLSFLLALLLLCLFLVWFVLYHTSFGKALLDPQWTQQNLAFRVAKAENDYWHAHRARPTARGVETATAVPSDLPPPQVEPQQAPATAEDVAQQRKQAAAAAEERAVINANRGLGNSTKTKRARTAARQEQASRVRGDERCSAGPSGPSGLPLSPEDPEVAEEQKQAGKASVKAVAQPKPHLASPTPATSSLVHAETANPSSVPLSTALTQRHREVAEQKQKDAKAKEAEEAEAVAQQRSQGAVAAEARAASIANRGKKRRRLNRVEPPQSTLRSTVDLTRAYTDWS